MRFKAHHVSDNYIYLDFGNVIDEKVNSYVISLFETINHKAVIEMIPSYSGLMIEFDEKAVSPSNLLKYIKKLKIEEKNKKGILHEIPVIYGGKNGEDLSYVAKNNFLTEQEVIKIHSGRDYRVYMMGFLPGFCYLGIMDSKISCPRRKEPRLRIEAGSVGIAGGQTGIYPSQSPGGWQIIGKTDFELYNPESENSFKVKSGDYIRFIPVKGA